MIPSAPLVEWFRENVSRFTGELRFVEPLSRHTYYRIGGPADLLAFPKCQEDLSWLAEGLRSTASRFFILGAGSNLLVSDDGFRGVVIKTSRMNLDLFALDDGHTIRTGASVAVSSFLRKAAQEGWGGLEFLAGVPGSIGGAIAMNAGTHLGETRDRVRAVEAFPLIGAEGGELFDPVRFTGSELRFDYRKNLFLPRGSLVWAAEWAVTRNDPHEVRATLEAVLARRKETQPLDYPSCGSVFMNPVGTPIKAWQVIEKVGLRGHRVGDAQFAEKHCNFIVNLGAARARDVTALIQLAKTRAKKELGIELHEEVRYLGFN